MTFDNFLIGFALFCWFVLCGLLIFIWYIILFEDDEIPKETITHTPIKPPTVASLPEPKLRFKKPSHLNI